MLSGTRSSCESNTDHLPAIHNEKHFHIPFSCPPVRGHVQNTREHGCVYAVHEGYLSLDWEQFPESEPRRYEYTVQLT